MDGPPAVIWREEVERLLRYEDLVPRLEQALGLFSRRDAAAVLQPVRTAVPLSKHGGFFLLMPAYMEQDGVLCTKLVCAYKREDESSLPATQATVMLLDPLYGNVKAVMDGEVITAMRTAAVSAISAKLLMRPGAEVLSILGTGKQARSHYEAFTQMFPFREVRVWSHSKERAESFVASLGGAASACVLVEAAVSGADAIVTATRSTEPLLLGRWVKPGAHVAAVGACRPDWRELDDRLMEEAVVYADSREAAMVESGDIILSGAEVFAELGEVLNGTKPAHRDKTTVFKSLGLAVEDAVSAKLVFDQWEDRTSSV
ncbi:ketimine reductase mu-crystallin [Salarias fasciatus]|uniref:ketimine reductase mu-crystallin n=1 Tax=Salarias fasciatus TaxID=181472 RepID=UPI0011768F4F|nr:ketimine reductase mu-crystallin [Salarias fasciatus]